MKFVFTALFATIVASVVAAASGSSSYRDDLDEEQRRELDAAALHARWFMHHPTISYDSAENIFTLDFPMSSTEMNATLGMLEEEFYDTNCKDDGSGFTEYIIPAGIVAPDGFSPAKMLNGPDGKPQLKFKVLTQVLANDHNIYTYYDGTNNTAGP